MITRESAQDILDADKARRDVKKEPLLTPAGREALANIVRIMKPMPQTDIDAVIRGSLKQTATA